MVTTFAPTAPGTGTEPGGPPAVTPARPAWRRHAPLALLLAATAVLYLWGLGASGYANDFYAAAVQAGTQSWKAWFFGSLDSANFITVDKPPAALWVMGLSGRIFGFNAWSMLVPQALEGVAAVGLLYATVRRWFGTPAAFVAGAVLALTPVAVLMFRFNNPDALLTLLLVAGAYATTRAVEKASPRWLALAGVALGFGFLTKMLQAFLVLPAFALAYLVAAPTSLRRRVLHLLGAGAALVVSAGWWVAIVQLWPASSRPYIGGSGDNSVLGLAFGYNGLGRIFGGSGPGGGGGPGGSTGGSGGGLFAGGGAPGGGGMGGGFGGATGLTRMFGSEFGTEISWLLPAALLLLVALAWLTRRAPRTDRTRAALLLWGGWLLVTAGVFSYMSGIIHPYYTVALAPAIGALVGIGGVVLWRERASWYARAALAAVAAVSGWWGYRLLARDATWHPWVRWTVLALGIAAAAALLLPARHRTPEAPSGHRVPGLPRRARVLGLATVALAAVAVLAGSAAYALPTAATPHTGSIPASGPSGAAAGGTGGPGGFAGRGPGGTGSGAGGTGSGTGGAGEQGSGGFPGGGTLPGGGALPEAANGAGGASGGPTSGGGAGPGGGAAATVDSELAALLRSAGTTWSAATTGDQSAAGLELASGTAVMAIGGWSGSDPAPTLAQFQAWVAAGQVHYYVGGGGGFAGQGGGDSIATWVSQHFTATTVGGSTVYDLTQPTG